MRVIHVRAEVSTTEQDVAFIAMVVGLVDGVRDIATVPSLGLISVLYDDERSEPSEIIGAVCSAGFEAHECRPRDVAVAAAVA
jgi:copper chaperone CopZ